MLRTLTVAIPLVIATLILTPAEASAENATNFVAAPPAGVKSAPRQTLLSVGMPMAMVLTIFVLVAYLAPMTVRPPDNTSKPKHTFSTSETAAAWAEWSRLDGEALASFKAGMAFPPIVSSHLDNAKADLLRGEVGAANWAMMQAARRAGW